MKVYLVFKQICEEKREYFSDFKEVFGKYEDAVKYVKDMIAENKHKNIYRIDESPAITSFYTKYDNDEIGELSYFIIVKEVK